jgi:hypothetical protein
MGNTKKIGKRKGSEKVQRSGCDKLPPWTESKTWVLVLRLWTISQTVARTSVPSHNQTPSFLLIVGIWTLSWKYTSSRISQNKTLWHAGPQVCSMEQCRAWDSSHKMLPNWRREAGGGVQKTDLLLCVENWCAIDEFAI